MSHQLVKSGSRSRTVLEVVIENTTMSFYDLFGLENLCDIDEAAIRAMKKQRHELSLRYHPDKGDIDDLADFAFRNAITSQINTAYLTLSNPDLKAVYDEDLIEAYGATPSASGDWHFLHWAGSKLKSAVKVAASVGAGAALGMLFAGPVGAIVGGLVGTPAGQIAEKATEMLCERVCGRAAATVSQSLADRDRARQRTRAHQALEDRRQGTLVYLPIKIGSKTVLEAAGCKQWRTTNKFLRTDAQWLAFRATMDNNDKIVNGDPKGPKWGDIVNGVDMGNGWVQVSIDMEAHRKVRC